MKIAKMQIKNPKRWLFMTVISASLVVIMAVAFVAYSIVYRDNSEPEIEIRTKDLVKMVSFGAVGDNLIHDDVYKAAATGGGGYDFRPFYTDIKDEISAVDVAYINQETPFAGAALGLSNYPTFNGPTEIIAAVVDAGFDWINTASNHSLDKGAAGIEAGLNFLDGFENVVQSGEARSQDEHDKVKYIEKNGVKIGLESFTYGLNGFHLPADKSFMVNLIDDDLIRQRMEKLNAETDVQIVSMHWGVEYSTTPNTEQERLAQLLADLGAEVIVAEHPHVIQPVRWVNSSDGTRKTLVIYSLGNFLSAQNDPINMLGLYVKWNIEYDFENKTADVTEVEILPLVNWQAPGFSDYRVVLLKDYSDELANSHNLRAQGTSREYFVVQSQKILGDEFKVVL